MTRSSVLLSVGCLLALFAAVNLKAMAQAGIGSAPVAFEVATIKPGGSTDTGDPNRTIYGGSCHGVDSHYPLTNQIFAPPPLGRCVFYRVNLKVLISRAYETSSGPGQPVKGGDSWMGSDQFDVQAKAEDPTTATEEQLRLMLRTFLADRFKLVFHREGTEVTGFVMVVGKNGPKLRPAEGEYSGVRGDGMRLSATSAPLSELARGIYPYVGGPVIDQTGLAGNYSFTVQLREPSVFTSIQEDLGLRLETQKVRIDYIVIDHAEKPTLP